MKDVSYNEFTHNRVTVFQKTETDENGVTISQSHEPFIEDRKGNGNDESEDDEVTHQVYFGENIRRVRKILFPKSRT